MFLVALQNKHAKTAPFRRNSAARETFEASRQA
jgi:hypothetical protein